MADSTFNRQKMIPDQGKSLPVEHSQWIWGIVPHQPHSIPEGYCPAAAFQQPPSLCPRQVKRIPKISHILSLYLQSYNTTVTNIMDFNYSVSFHNALHGVTENTHIVVNTPKILMLAQQGAGQGRNLHSKLPLAKEVYFHHQRRKRSWASSSACLGPEPGNETVHSGWEMMIGISSLTPLILQAVHLGALRCCPQSETLHPPHPGHPHLLPHCPEEWGKKEKSLK